MSVAASVLKTVNRKYYPVVQGGVPDCEKAYVNVLASSPDEEEYSIVCCDGDDHSTASICATKVRDNSLKCFRAIRSLL